VEVILSPVLVCVIPILYYLCRVAFTLFVICYICYLCSSRQCARGNERCDSETVYITYSTGESLLIYAMQLLFICSWYFFNYAKRRLLMLCISFVGSRRVRWGLFCVIGAVLASCLVTESIYLTADPRLFLTIMQSIVVSCYYCVSSFLPKIQRSTICDVTPRGTVDFYWSNVGYCVINFAYWRS